MRTTKQRPRHRAASAPARVEQFFADLGPGLITGAADDDPSGISTYSVTGASFRYAPLWIAPVSFPLMVWADRVWAKSGRQFPLACTAAGFQGRLRQSEYVTCISATLTGSQRAPERSGFWSGYLSTREAPSRSSYVWRRPSPWLTTAPGMSCGSASSIWRLSRLPPGNAAERGGCYSPGWGHWRGA